MLRPSIYVGLGGTGVRAVAHAKKMFEDEHGVGNIPPEIAFLAVDFDNAISTDTSLATDITEDFILLRTPVNPHEQYAIRHSQHGEYQWMFDGNTNFIANRIKDGASQVRTTGRLYTEIVLPQFTAAFNRAITRVTNISNVNSKDAQSIDVHIVCSLAGGSGAGSFLTIAESIHVAHKQSVKMYGYGVLHSIFETMDPAGNLTPRVFSNAYSALMDIDYLMHASTSDPVEITIDERKHELTRHLFDEFYVIDSCTQSGQSVNTVKDLSEVIGTCLFVSGSDVGNAKDTIASNVDWTKGEGNVDNKKGWAYGLGACSVVYKGELLAQIYGIKAAIELVRRMQQEEADIYGKALLWTEEVGIREDNVNEENVSHDMLIDSIYSKANITSLPECPVYYKDSDANIRATVNNYLNKYINFPTDADLKKRAEELKVKLNERVNNMLNAENGVGNACVFVAELKSHCEKFKEEMSNEQQELDLKISELQDALFSKNFKDYEAECNRFSYRFKGGNNKQTLIEESLGYPATEILRLKHDSKRREAAYTIFVAIVAELDFLLEKVTLLNKKLSNLKEEYVTLLNNKQTNVQSSLVFEYDLSINDRRNIKLNTDEILVDNFINSLNDSLLNIDINNDLKQSIDNYTSNLPTANVFKARRIIDVVNELSEDKYQELKDRIISLSSTLLRYDNRGQRTLDGRNVTDALKWGYMISLNAKTDETTRFENDTAFLRHDVCRPQYIKSEAMHHQKIIFYRTEGAILPYCLAAFSEYKIDMKYTNVVKLVRSGAATFNPHHDRLIFEKMREKDFKLKPEMKGEAMFYWTCGHFFGWEKIKEEARIMKRDERGNVISEDHKELVENLKYVCCLRKKYMYWDVNLPAGRDKQWQPLGNTSRRDTAFNYFKTVVLPEHKENFKSIIKNVYGQQVAFWRGEIARFISDGFEDYIDKIVCSDKGSVTYAASNSGEYKLLQEEFQYIKNDLLNALDSLR